MGDYVTCESFLYDVKFVLSNKITGKSRVVRDFGNMSITELVINLSSYEDITSDIRANIESGEVLSLSFKLNNTGEDFAISIVDNESEDTFMWYSTPVASGIIIDSVIVHSNLPKIVNSAMDAESRCTMYLEKYYEGNVASSVLAKEVTRRMKILGFDKVDYTSFTKLTTKQLRMVLLKFDMAVSLYNGIKTLPAFTDAMVASNVITVEDRKLIIGETEKKINESDVFMSSFMKASNIMGI